MSPREYEVLPFSVVADTACIHHAIARCSFSSAEGAEAHTSPEMDRESDKLTQHVEAMQCNINHAFVRLWRKAAVDGETF